MVTAINPHHVDSEKPAAPVLFTPDELRLLGDEQFFRAKARIMNRIGGADNTGMK